MVLINRRNTLMGIAALSASGAATEALAASGPHLSHAEHPDAALLTLDKEMGSIKARMDRAFEICREIDEQGGGWRTPSTDDAEKVAGDLMCQQWEMGKSIFAVPAYTLAGLAVKVRAHDRMFEHLEEDVPDVLTSISTDIRRLVEGGSL